MSNARSHLLMAQYLLIKKDFLKDPTLQPGRSDYEYELLSFTKNSNDR